MIRALAPGLLLLTCASPLAKQAYQCRFPPTATAPEICPDGPIRTTAVTGYIMVLSWSPEFCRPRAGQRGNARGATDGSAFCSTDYGCKAREAGRNGA